MIIFISIKEGFAVNVKLIIVDNALIIKINALFVIQAIHCIKINV